MIVVNPLSDLARTREEGYLGRGRNQGQVIPRVDERTIIHVDTCKSSVVRLALSLTGHGFCLEPARVSGSSQYRT